MRFPGSGSTPRSCARTRRARSPRTCSASPAPTTTASTGSSARSTRRSPGRPGFETIVKDPFGRAIDVVTSRAERPGKNVTLTIDHQIQANAEQILARTVKQFDARGAAAIVMDPRTGAILAMANYPTFDANRLRDRLAGRPA